VIDQCFPNPTASGYVRCGLIDTGAGGFIEQYCRPGARQNSAANGFGRVNCGAGTQPIDINGDGLADTCAAIQQQQQQQSSLCSPGYEPRDTNGDGVADICYQVTNTAPPPPAPGSADACPQGFPYGKDTNFDGRIDTCYANPA